MNDSMDFYFNLENGHGSSISVDNHPGPQNNPDKDCGTPVPQMNPGDYFCLPYNLDLWLKPNLKTPLEWVESTPFPTSVFPPGIREFVEKASAQLGVSCDLIGATALAVAGSVAGRSIHLRLAEDYHASPSLYLCLVTKSGRGKTPCIEKVMAPIVDGRLTNGFGYYLTHAQSRAVYLRMIENGKAKEGNTSLLYMKDELKGLLSIIYSRNSGNEERQNFLSLFDGIPINILRTSNPFDANIPKPMLSLVGGMVPDDLHLLKNGSGEDGLTGRFLFAIPRQTDPDCTFPEAPPHCAELWAEILKQVDGLNLVKPPAGGNLSPRVATMEPGASDLFLQFKRMFRKLATEKAISRNDSIDSLMGKADLRLGRLALILQLLWDAELSIPEGAPDLKSRAIVVTPVTMLNAILLMFYFHVNSSLALFGINLTPLQTTAINLFRYCKENSVKSLNKSDLVRNHYKRMTGCRDTADALKVFEAIETMELGEIVEGNTGKKGGRPSTVLRLDLKRNP
jgi:hypothetical protein